MRNNTFPYRLARTVLALAFLTAPAAAQTLTGFVPPAKAIEIPFSPTPPETDAITCYVYDDVMIRIQGNRSVSPEDALILPRTVNGTPTTCDRNLSSGGTILHNGGLALDGRWGVFVLFKAAHPSGVSNFKIFDVRHGRKLFEDDQLRITAVALVHGILHVRYIRGVDPRCSLLSDRKTCWSHVLARGLLPRGAFPGPPSVQNCKEGYIRDRIGPVPAPDDDLSIISYQVALTVDSMGRATVRPLGGLQCEAMP